MSVARYMSLCLGHPEHGFYMRADPLGRDFTTAPEISQMFGEMIGAWVTTVARPLGATRLVELGPGRGTLMADAARVMARAGLTPEIWLVETSPALRSEQATRVPGARWTARLEEVPEGPAVFLANEFLDALPVHQFLRSADGWRERQIGLVDGALAWGLSAPLPRRDTAPEGAWEEHAPSADAVVTEIARRLAAHPGAALLVDYGYMATDRPAGPTLQAVQRGTKVDPLANPGESDLTWLVDFDRLARTLGGQLTTQRAFLAALGIGQRATALARSVPEKADEIATALERLTAPAQMGTLFKVLGAASDGFGPLPGFQTMMETP